MIFSRAKFHFSLFLNVFEIFFLSLSFNCQNLEYIVLFCYSHIFFVFKILCKRDVITVIENKNCRNFEQIFQENLRINQWELLY